MSDSTRAACRPCVALVLYLWVRSTPPSDNPTKRPPLDAGVGHVYIKPATPRLNGKVERSHRIDQEEFYRMLNGVVIDNTNLFNERLQQWGDFCNFNRPHGGLAGDTPYEKLRNKTTAPV